VAKLLRDSGLDPKAVRGRQHHGGPNSPDVYTELPYHFEVKRTAVPSLYAAFKQACDDCPNDKAPIVVHRHDKEEWMAFLRFDMLLDLMKSMAGKL